MGTIRKKTFTKPLPADAKIIVRKGQRLAEWIDAKEKRRTAPVTTGKDGNDRIVITSRTYTAKFRDGSGIVREVATGCRDEAAARSILSKLERRAELVRGEVITASEDAVIDHQSTPLVDHIADYLTKLESEGTTQEHRANVRRALVRLAKDCQYKRLSNLARESLERWLVSQEKAGMGARTRNTYRAAAVAFCNWSIETGRLITNPFAAVAKADEATDLRRQRRALTEDELIKLLDVAQHRPLIEVMTVRRGKRKGGVVAVLREETRRRLKRLGQERALIYKTLVLTGLRKGELASITVGQVAFDADMPYLILNAADEKNRQGSTIPLRLDLADDLRGWLSDRVTALQEAAQGAATVQFDPEHQKRQKRNTGDSAGCKGHFCLPLSTIPTLSADTPLFTIPRDLVRILDRDLVAAGLARRVKIDGKWKIDKRDERGRTIDVHALRHTYGTLLSAAGVAPRTAQAAMRHSDVNLTMNVYTDPKLLDVAGAIKALPSLPLSLQGEQAGVDVAGLRATGTENATAKNIDARTLRPNVTPIEPSQSLRLPLAPVLAPTTGKTSMLQSILDNLTEETDKMQSPETVAVSAYCDKRKQSLTPAVNGCQKERETGFEPATSSLGS